MAITRSQSRIEDMGFLVKSELRSGSPKIGSSVGQEAGDVGALAGVWVATHGRQELARRRRP